MLPSSQLESAIHYRQDIDGIRAIAVFSVVLYHFFPEIMPGGFIGVDIFFVISGYLISSILLRKNKENTFDILDFYARRIKRIFPALSIVLLSCLVFGWFALLTSEYKQLAKHVISSTLFAQNITLLSESNYFDNASITKPLLHLWSLGIEEQFYLIWPLFIFICIRYNKKLSIAISTIGLISFIIGVWYIHQGMKAAAYFSPISRAWELLAGATIALLHSNKVYIKKNSPTENTIAFIGLILIIWGFYFIDKNKNFPGVYALIPVIGTCLLIFTNSENKISRNFLSTRPMIFIGLISYPLYLWHWPLISFASILDGKEPVTEVKITLIIFAIVLSWLTFHVIEKPLRHSNYSRKTIITLIISSVIICFSGCIIYAEDGISERENASLQGYPGDIGHDEFHKYIATHFFLCTPDNIAKTALKWNNYTRCMQSKSDEKIDIVLLGDSHAEHLFIGMAESLPNKNIAFYIEDGSPFPENPKFQRLYEAIIKNENIKTVILTMYWKGRFGETPSGKTLEEEISETANLFVKVGKKVLLTDDIADFPFTPDKCKGRRWLSFGNPVCTISADESNQQLNIYQPILKSIADKNPNVTLLAEHKYLCSDAGCSMVKDGKLMYRDTHHLNINGSRYIGKKLITENESLFK